MRDPKTVMRITIIVALLVIVTMVAYRYFLDDEVGPTVIAYVSPDQEVVETKNPTRMKEAMELALADWKEENGPVPVEFRHFTYTEYPGQVYQDLQALRAADRLSAVVGDITSDSTELLAQLARDLNVPHISPLARDDDIFGHYDNSFSLRLLLEEEAEHLHGLFTARLDAQNLAILHTDRPKSRIEAEHLRDHLAGRINVPFVHELPYESDDFAAMIEDLKDEADLDAVMLLLRDGQKAAFVQQAKAADLNTKFVVSSSTEDWELLRSQSGACDTLWGVMTWHAVQALEEDTEQQAFQQRFAETMDTDTMNNFGASVYASVRILLEVMSIQGSQAPYVLQGLTEYQGSHLIGAVEFGDSGLLTESVFRTVEICDGELEMFQ